MAVVKLKRYGLEGIAKAFIAISLLLLIVSWIAAFYYYGIIGKSVLFIIPLIFTLASALILLMLRYRYALFERYPYLMNLPSLFYRIEDKKGKENRSRAFSMIFTVHSLVLSFMGFLSLLLTISIGSSIKSSAESPLLYAYLGTVVVLVVAVLLLYRRIYIKFSK